MNEKVRKGTKKSVNIQEKVVFLWLWAMFLQKFLVSP